MKNAQRKYGQTFLTKVRWTTDDVIKADNSFFVWGTPKRGYYTLTFLGVINGFLHRVGLTAIAHVERETKEITRFEIVKKWWK